MMEKIKAIILDLGGVILNLDPERTVKMFHQLGAEPERINTELPLFTDYEKGKLTSADFRDGLRPYLKSSVTDEEIDNAWNAMLCDIPLPRFELISKLKNHFPIYLLSNTNEIHIQCFEKYLRSQKRDEEWQMIFHHQFLSYKMGMRKPDSEIYEFVSTSISIEPEHCLFIDDNKNNLVGAESVGMKTIWAERPLSHSTLAEIQLHSLVRF